MMISASAVPVVRAALLIDVDNFHDAEQLRAIHSQFGQIAGKGFVCHAHGDVKKLYDDALKPVWQEMAARLMPCLPLNKNTTDAGLIVDALVLHFQQGVRRFGIASGDADFAPLSLQLKELGCEVSCFARKSIAFEAMVGYYDRVVRFDVIPANPKATQEVALVVSSGAPAVIALDVKPNLPTAPVAEAATRVGLDKVKAVEKVTAAPAAKPANELRQSALALLPQDLEIVRKILQAFPQWRPLTLMQLNQLGAPLREVGLKKGNAPLHQFFRKYPGYFTVLPLSGLPTKVRLEKKP